nr:glycosyltransferase family 39 protein [Terriglobales bacterium]
ALFYVFSALGMLAKGPVAPFLAALIIVIFAALKRDLKLCWRTLWLPGILLFCAVALPWYIAVQIRNPDFFRIFIVEHNLERFGSNLYHHAQPFWYYVPVLLLGWLPWTALAATAALLAVQGWRSLPRSTDSLPLFLSIWLFTVLIFFSISRSKLPGYVLPALPAGTILLAEYLRRRVSENKQLPLSLIICHSLVAAAPLFPALMLQYIVLQHRIPWTTPAWISLAITSILAIGMAVTLRMQGLRVLRFVTLVAVVLTVAAILRIGAPALDAQLSARPVADDLAHTEGTPKAIAVFHVSRELEYGLAFYRNRPVSRFENRQVPSGETLLVSAEGGQPQFSKVLPGRRISHLGSYAPQHLEYFWIAAAPHTP